MAKKYIANFFIIVGIIIISIMIAFNIRTMYYERKYVKEYNNYLKLISDNKNEEDKYNKNFLLDNIYKGENTEYVNDSPSEDTNKEKEVIYEGNKHDLFLPQAIGILNIPKIDINVGILIGTDDSALKYTVGHHPNSAGIGENGNCVILGHRNYVYGRYFRKLNEITIGDEVNIIKDNKTYKYIVTETLIVEEEDVWVMYDTENASITLITCTPIGTYDKRLVVKGTLESIY